MRNDICGPACTGPASGHAEVLVVIGGRPARSNRTATSAMVVAGWAVSDERAYKAFPNGCGFIRSDGKSASPNYKKFVPSAHIHK